MTDKDDERQHKRLDPSIQFDSSVSLLREYNFPDALELILRNCFARNNDSQYQCIHVKTSSKLHSYKCK